MIKPSDLSKIIKKVLDLTKQVYLQEPPGNAGLVRKFFAGKRSFSILESSFGLEWWLTKRGVDCCEDIANMAISYDLQLRGGDSESFGKIIEKSLQENANNSNIFNVNKLFDLRSELVHGGASEISDWGELDSYRRHFKSHPLEDVKTAAMAALRTYTKLPI